MSAVCGGQAVALEYQAMLGLPGVTEGTVRRAIRYNPSVRDALRAALRTLPEVAAAAHSVTLERAAELSRGADSQRSTGEVYAQLCPAAQARVVKALNLPSNVTTWAQISERCKIYGSELLANCVVLGEHNAEAAAQRPEQLAQTERRYLQLPEAGRVRVTNRVTTFGQAAVQWPELARYAQARNEVAELATLIELQHAKERAAGPKRAAKAPAAQAAPAAPAAPPPPPLDIPLPTKIPDPRTKRTTNHRKRRVSAGKA